MTAGSHQIDELSGMRWADAAMFTSFGVRIGIRVSVPSAASLLEGVLPPGSSPSSARGAHRLYSLVVGASESERGIRRDTLLYDGEQRLAKMPDLAPVLKLLEINLRHTVAEMAPRRVYVHAGVVEHRGRAIVIPGSSMAGKSTLVSELIKRGATYYSDEYAVLDEKGLVHPFPKPVSLRPRGSYEAIDYAADRFGATIGIKPVPVGMVVIARYAAGARWRPRTLTPAQGVLALLSHAIAARRDPRRVMSSLRCALASALTIKGMRGEASDLADHLLEQLEEKVPDGRHCQN
jgi:hypothetical protein